MEREAVREDDEHLVVVSIDTHVGPRLEEEMKPYCPAEHLDDFAAFADRAATRKEAIAGVARYLVEHPNFRTDGHHDSDARLADHDYDGVAAGVIFHGSENLEPMPFGPLFPGDTPRDRGLVEVGQKMYNRWLVDFVAHCPTRHVGLAYVPMWDIDAAIVELEWAHDHGLSAVNFPALRAGAVLEYNHRDWDPFWARCEERGIPLVTHVGVAGNVDYGGGADSYAIRLVESGSFFSHRAVWWLVFAGVFERFPGLKLMITETPGTWINGLAGELDAIWNMFAGKEMNHAFFETVPRLPSEYLHQNIFLGASFASAHEVHEAVEHGFGSQLCWGSDYPHVEGTYLNPDGCDMPSVTRLALRNTFCGADPRDIERMVGETAIDVFGLDRDSLQAVASEIGAPTLRELRTPIDLDGVPEGASMHAFRSGDGGWS